MPQRKSVLEDYRPHLTNLIRLGLSGFGLKIDDLVDLVAGIYEVTPANPFRKTKGMQQTPQLAEADFSIGLRDQYPRKELGGGGHPQTVAASGMQRVRRNFCRVFEDSENPIFHDKPHQETDQHHDDRNHKPTDALHAFYGGALQGDGFLGDAAHAFGLGAGEFEMFTLLNECLALTVTEVGEELRDFVFAGHAGLLGGGGAEV